MHAGSHGVDRVHAAACAILVDVREMFHKVDDGVIFLEEGVALCGDFWPAVLGGDVERGVGEVKLYEKLVEGSELLDELVARVYRHDGEVYWLRVESVWPRPENRFTRHALIFRTI